MIAKNKLVRVLIMSAASLILQPNAYAIMFFSSQKISSSTSMGGQFTAANLSTELTSSPQSISAICAEAIEIEHAIICGFRSKLMMNDSLIRIGFFTGVGSGFPKGTIISNNSPVLADFKGRIGGHTVNGDEISAFERAAQSETEPAKKLSALESEFKSDILENARFPSLSVKSVVIAFPIESTRVDLVLRHEICHAKLYLSQEYKEIVVGFWENVVTESDKAEIRKLLDQTYNAADEAIMMDEFQAYLLQDELLGNPVGSLVPKYAATLRNLLNKK